MFVSGKRKLPVRGGGAKLCTAGFKKVLVTLMVLVGVGDVPFNDCNTGSVRARSFSKTMIA
jgi:hypothetical protein